jgi:hypothetical protein
LDALEETYQDISSEEEEELEDVVVAIEHLDIQCWLREEP